MVEAPGEASAAVDAPTAAEPAGASAVAAVSMGAEALMAAEPEDGKKGQGPLWAPGFSIYWKSPSVSMPRWSSAFLTPSSQTGVVT